MIPMLLCIGFMARAAGLCPSSLRALSEAIKADAVDRTILGRQVLGNPQALKDLETLMHPLVRAESQRWLKGDAAAAGGSYRSGYSFAV